MRSNTGTTTLRSRSRRADPMLDYDRLPPEVRAWVATAKLRWGPKSVHKAYARAVAKTGDTALALRELDKVQARLVAKDALQIWGETHPVAQSVGG